MKQMLKQTETQNTQTQSNTVKHVVGVIFSIIEVILAFRLIFKLLGANPDNVFIQAIYAVSHFFTVGFENIFSTVTTTTGAKATGYLDPATLIAMVVFALICWAIMALIIPRFGTRIEKTEYTENDNNLK